MPISRIPLGQLKQCSSCKIELDLSMFYKHKKSKFGRRPTCKSCDKDYREKNKEHGKEYSKQYQIKNSKLICEKRKVARALHTAEKKLEIKQKCSEYYFKNKYYLQSKNKEWVEKNRHKMNAIYAKYNATKLKATPKWANFSRIECYYSVANMLNKEKLKVWEVDHIIPLQGKKVCGLHVETNLRVITREENRSKSNSFEML
jgi:hypothetical protein